MPKNPYSGGRNLVALAHRIDEDTLIRRYAQDKWSVSQCAKAFGISVKRARDILRSYGVELRGRKSELDPEAVLRAYAKLGNYNAVGRLLGADPSRVVRILDENDVQHDSPAEVPDFGNRSAANAARRRRLAAEPGPGDLLSPSEATLISGKSTGQLLALSRHGQLRNCGNEHRPRYRRSDVKALTDEPAPKTAVTDDSQRHDVVRAS